jgi:hypothetical protein
MTTGNGSGSMPDGPADTGASPGRVPGCPSWCAGQHRAGDHCAAFHRRIIAQRGAVSVALSCEVYRDPYRTGYPVIILDAGAPAEPAELEESAAIRLLAMLEAAGGGSSLLAGALRSALDLLDPGVSWAGREDPRVAGVALTLR